MSQIVTGILLAMFYNPNVALAFVTILTLIMKFILVGE
ncbi:MAG: hypothetical protein IPH43_15175 [Xanthomonadales bacterium]|nr:hypothetical protein [Xanthomonadales bacterium]